MPIQYPVSSILLKNKQCRGITTSEPRTQNLRIDHHYMPLYAYFINESPVKLWGLTSQQRNMRILKSTGVTDIVKDFNVLPDNQSALLLRADYLFDDRVIRYLVQSPDVLLKISQAPTDRFVAAHVATDKATQAVELIKGASVTDPISGVRTETLETLSLSFQERLRKVERPFVLAITPRDSSRLERRLFDWSYKGVTDLVTKWAWPLPARWVVGQCVRFGLRPNHVTIVGLLLVILAGVLFAYGQYGWGLLAGWLMTFLDTVDGKLARVTVTSSRFGHYFDHIIDIVHPPIWYALWGLGLGTASPGNAAIALKSGVVGHFRSPTRRDDWLKGRFNGPWADSGFFAGVRWILISD